MSGCDTSAVDGVISYDSRQGDSRGTEMDFYDFTYDGSVSDGQLIGGLGQLTDYEIGSTNFRLDSQNLGRKGYEWVGWRNDSSSRSLSDSRRVYIVFHFDQVLRHAVLNLIVIGVTWTKLCSSLKLIVLT